jgi:PhnB protein
MAKPIPDGYTAVTPYLVVNDAKAQIDFLTRAFGATVNLKMDVPDGTIGHADVSVFGAHVMIGQASDRHPAMPAMVHLYVADADRVHAQAAAAGGKVEMPVTDQFYGDRAGSVRDVNGNVWWISTHGEDLSPEELQRRMVTAHQQQQPK